MIQEKNSIINIKLSKKSSTFNTLYKQISESLYLLFDLILENPIENIWFECLFILIGYSQLILFIFDPTVSIYKFIIIKL